VEDDVMSGLVIFTGERRNAHKILTEETKNCTFGFIEIITGICEMDPNGSG
jgi:hypothetical protein